jgi:hypothetical protein
MKTLSDLARVTDDVNGAAADDDANWSFFKNRSEVATAQDILTRVMTYTRQLSDTASIAETVARSTTKQFADAFIAGDAAVISMVRQRSASESSSVADAIVRGITKSIVDSAQASDFATRSVFRARTDLATSSDAASKTAGKASSDIASTSDGGSVMSQGYTSGTYFAEDYVGTYRTF